MSTTRCYKGGKEYILETYANKTDASIDGGSVFGVYDGGIKFLPTIDPKYVSTHIILFRGQDGNGKERCVVHTRTPVKKTYIELSNVTSYQLIIPKDRFVAGGEIRIYGGNGENGSSGKYGLGNLGDGGSGGAGGQGLSYNMGVTAGTTIDTQSVYGGGGGGGGRGGFKDNYGKITTAAGDGGAGGNGGYKTITYTQSLSGRVINISSGSSVNGKSGNSGSKTSGGSGGASGSGKSGGSQSRGNGGRGGDEMSIAPTLLTKNSIVVIEYCY